MEFGPFRPKTVERWSVRLVKNLKIESKLGFQVKMSVFEGLSLGDLRGLNMTACGSFFFKCTNLGPQRTYGEVEHFCGTRSSYAEND